MAPTRRGRYRRLEREIKGTFDISDTSKVRHRRFGIWDFYEEIGNTHIHSWVLPGADTLDRYVRATKSMSYIWRMIQDVLAIRGCSVLLALYTLLNSVSSLIPALSLWYSGQLLAIVQTAIDKRTVDHDLLIRVAAGRIACSIGSKLIDSLCTRIYDPVRRRVGLYYRIRAFHATARLDLPTFEDPGVQRQLEATHISHRSSVAMDAIVSIINLWSTFVEAVSQITVLRGVLQEQPGSGLLVTMVFMSNISRYMFRSWTGGTSRIMSGDGVWAATTQNQDYVRMEGMQSMVNDHSMRQELVGGGLGEHFTREFEAAAARVDTNAADFFDSVQATYQNRIFKPTLLLYPLHELPQIVFSLQAVQKPASIPVSLASLQLVQQAVATFTNRLTQLMGQTESLLGCSEALRKIYEIEHIPNKIVDGTLPFPENEKLLEMGVSIEFRNVSFMYPEADAYALHDVSFKIMPGELCVIVGVNGSGKSTILKLITRLYDCTEGEILLDGHNVKEYRLRDLRRGMSVLFQDFKIWPFTLGENIGLGDPERMDDADAIQQAAQLGGALEFVERLPGGLDHYLRRPVRDYYSQLPEGTKMLFGREVDYGRLRGMGGMANTNSSSLSGGQMQRLAVARTFMSSLLSEHRVGLLLFDEPSAALDPSAEHDLFERLRQLRGSKTMIFSSHRFGNLTRHANLILYMNDSRVVEMGTHDQLRQLGGEYARLWSLQAQAFV